MCRSRDLQLKVGEKSIMKRYESHLIYFNILMFVFTYWTYEPLASLTRMQAYLPVSGPLEDTLDTSLHDCQINWIIHVDFMFMPKADNTDNKTLHLLKRNTII